jgi:hypothetical protein
VPAFVFSRQRSAHVVQGKSPPASSNPPHHRETKMPRRPDKDLPCCGVDVFSERTRTTLLDRWSVVVRIGNESGRLW